MDRHTNLLQIGILASLASICGCAGVPMADSSMYASCPIEGENHTVVVEANQGWQPSGIEVRQGDAVFLEAQGQWMVDMALWPLTGPNGYQGGMYRLPTVCPDQAIGVLCARIGSGYGFRVGKQLYLPEVGGTGMLSFVCNECFGDWWDNAGSMRVEVVVRRAGTKQEAKARTDVVSCDLRMVQVSDGTAVASASGEASSDRLADLAKALSRKLKEGLMVKGETVAVVSLRNRSGTAQGKVVADELADKLGGALIDTGWFEIKERIDLRGLLSEQDLETAGLVKNEDVKKKLAGVKYIVIGGVTVNADSGK